MSEKLIANLRQALKLKLKTGSNVTLLVGLNKDRLAHGKVVNIDPDHGLVDIIWYPTMHTRGMCPVTTENARDLELDTDSPFNDKK